MTPFDVADDSSYRHIQHHAVTVFAVFVRPRPVRATFRAPVPLTGQRGQAVDIAGRDQDDVSAVSAVTAVGAPLGNLELAAEAHRAVATVAAFDVNCHSIHKHDCTTL